MAQRILIVSHEAPAAAMAGPAIRYWELAHALSREHRVTLAAPGPVGLNSPHVRLLAYERGSGRALRAMLTDSDCVLVAGYLLRHYPFLAASLPVVVDLYDPFILENLAIHAAQPPGEQQALHRIDLSVLAQLLARGDYFICASEQQRDFWLGMLTASGRVNPQTVGDDASLRRLIDVVAFGLPAAPPEKRKNVLRGVVPGIEAGDRVVLWGGGVWDWFDPLTAIRAVAELAPRRHELRLFFAGVRHPNPAVPAMRQAAAAQALSDELGLTGRHVFFNAWMPYAERGDYLLEADAGLSLHQAHVETRFAFRTRLLDGLWSGLPMVLTAGDQLSALAASAGLARLVRPGDVAGVARALDEVLALAPQSIADRMARARSVATDLQWPEVVAPLSAYCRAPWRAADQAGGAGGPRLGAHLIPKALASLRARGLSGLLRDIRVYLGR